MVLTKIQKELAPDVTNSIIGGAGSSLDTLEEVASAIGNDANFALTVQNQLNNKLELNTLNLAGQKGSISDTDNFVLLDSLDTNSLKRSLWSTIKSSLKSYFDGIYQAVLGFVPVQQGGGTNQNDAKIFLGHRTGVGPTITVNQTDFGPLSFLGHNHDDRYYTESEIDSSFANLQGASFVGALHANQFTYERSTTLAINTNLNNVTTSGFYDGTALINSPDGTSAWFYLIVQRHANNNGYCLQIAVHLNLDDVETNNIYLRRQRGGTWGAWRTIALI